MRLFVLACVAGCRGPAFVEPVRPVEAVPPAIVETIEGPTSTPGWHPQIPRLPSARDLDATAIRRVIRRRREPVVACYERLSPGDRRRVVIRFTIGPTGSVLRSTASGPQGAFENCMAAAFAGTTFDPPMSGGTVTVTYPMQHRPG